MNIRLNFFFLALGALFLTTPASAAPVKSISLEVFKDGAERFWEVSVNCQSLNQPRVMRRPIDSDKWCSIDATNLCDKNKFSLSRQLCSDNFSQQVVNLKNDKPQVETKQVETKTVAKAAEKPAVEGNKAVKKKTKSANGSKSKQLSSQLASRENLLKEQMQIEEQRILIQQKRIELRRRELSLQKRQLNAS